MPQEWFVVPITTETDPGGNEITGPDFLGHDFDRYAGLMMDFSASKYSDLPWHPNTMYVVRVDADQSVLDALAGESNAWGKAHEGISDAEVAEYLNDRRGEEKTFEEWEQTFING